MRVVVAVDGSEPAKLAVDLVADCAWPRGTEIAVVQAIETGTDLFGGPWPALALVKQEEIEAELRAAAESAVHEARERLARDDRTVEAVVLHGRPATAIVDHARQMRADLIVIASRGHGTIGSMLLGSVSSEVVDHAPSPVLVARGTRIERIVLGWDGSATAARAVDLVRGWPIFAGSSVRVVSVAPTETPWWTGFPEAGTLEALNAYLESAEHVRRQHAELARELAAELATAGLGAEADGRSGDPATEILAAATASDADLIVIGTHGRTGLQRLLLGSVARNVLHHAACSVLIAREASGQG
jgi:nucleotide-binding universal stress UspA family protein